MDYGGSERGFVDWQPAGHLLAWEQSGFEYQALGYVLSRFSADWGDTLA